MPSTEAIAHRVTIDLGRRLREARERLGLSQQAAAIRAKMDLRWWQRIEKGGRGLTIHTLVKAATGLGVTFWEVVCGPPIEAGNESPSRPRSPARR